MGVIHQEYYDANDAGHWEIVIDYDFDNSEVMILDNIYKLFDKNIVDEIVKTHKMVISK